MVCQDSTGNMSRPANKHVLLTFFIVHCELSEIILASLGALESILQKRRVCFLA